MGQIEHFNLTYLYITIRYMTKLIMQFLRLNETCRMICYSILSNNVNLVEIGHGFVRSNANISYKIHFFFGEKILVALDTYAKKN